MVEAQVRGTGYMILLVNEADIGTTDYQPLYPRIQR
jgi:hypothetical protein